VDDVTDAGWKTLFEAVELIVEVLAGRGDPLVNDLGQLGKLGLHSLGELAEGGSQDLGQLDALDLSPLEPENAEADGHIGTLLDRMVELSGRLAQIYVGHLDVRHFSTS
jgi:hypothetical protein